MTGTQGGLCLVQVFGQAGDPETHYCCWWSGVGLPVEDLLQEQLPWAPGFLWVFLKDFIPEKPKSN